ncbi:MAG TPA: type III-A CRISPR-associated RAMP protein Csm5 [Chitinophagales bacterium]|nr:type III-A CRISPR-associated RAMP protein Csm5 [Chitinophagales bacterium]
MKLYLKLLTPLHIGSGNDLQPIDYVIANTRYYHLTQKFVFNFMKANNLLDAYTRWVNKTAQQISNIENIPKKNRKLDQNQQLSQLRKDFNLLKFCEGQKKTNQLIRALENASGLIKISLNKAQPDRNIREQITDGTHTPYIPGTSIKGAIRTALLYQWLKSKNPVNDLINIFNSDLRNRDIKKEQFGNKIENLAFYCGIEIKKDNRTEISYTDEKFDLLKLLSVSDGKIISSGNPLTLIKTNLYLRDNTRQPQSPWVEAVAAGCMIEFALDFNIRFLFALKDNIRDNAVMVDKKKQWIGIATKAKELFGIDIASLTEANLEENRHKAIQQVLSAITVFSNKQKLKNEQWKEEIKPKQQIKEGSVPQFTKEKIDFSFIPEKGALNLGFASGFAGTTEMLYLIDNGDLKKAFKRVMEKFGIGDKPGAGRKRQPGETYKANPDKFPKSRTMYEDGNGSIKPLGWALVMNVEEYKNSGRKVAAAPQTYQAPTPPPAYAPQYFTGKLKPGAGPIDAIVVHGGKPNKLKLFIKGYEDKLINGFGSVPLPEGQKVQVVAAEVNKKTGEITSVTIKALKS